MVRDYLRLASSAHWSSRTHSYTWISAFILRFSDSLNLCFVCRRPTDPDCDGLCFLRGVESGTSHFLIVQALLLRVMVLAFWLRYPGSTWAICAMKFHFFAGTFAVVALSFVLTSVVADDYSCSAAKPCSNGACCGASGYCGYGQCLASFLLCRT